MLLIFETHAHCKATFVLLPMPSSAMAASSGTSDKANRHSTFAGSVAKDAAMALRSLTPVHSLFTAQTLVAAGI